MSDETVVTTEETTPATAMSAEVEDESLPDTAAETTDDATEIVDENAADAADATEADADALIVETDPGFAPPEETPAEVTETVTASPALAAEPQEPKKPAYDPNRGRRKVRVGLVVSSKMQKTVVVMIETRVRHPLYGKFMRRSARFKAHDEISCGEGDTVEIMETRPLSKDKRWRVVRILQKAK